jgi:fructuronate reductase
VTGRAQRPPRAGHPTRLARKAGDGRPIAPVRQVHLGLGAFFRAHQAWYTDRAPDASRWGIAAFTGRSAGAAESLAAQDCLYTLLSRGNDADAFTVISALAHAHPAADAAAWEAYLASPRTSILSLTVTEAAYRRDSSGGLDWSDSEVAKDLAAWRTGMPWRASTVPARLAIGFAARRATDAGPITLMSCDNLPTNSRAALRVASDFAAAVDEALAAWIDENVRAVDTLVDRITPAATSRDVAEIRERTGRDDLSPVVTEPYTEWVLSDTFGSPRPAWENAGALVTAEILPYEQRKLWLLNGAHSLLAYTAPNRGHYTVADAIEDPVVTEWLHAWWRSASPHVTLPAAETTAYCSALLERFDNVRMRHRLSQIAADGSQKLRVRIVPVIRNERAANRMPEGAVRALGGWLAHLRGSGVPVRDPAATELVVTVHRERPRDAARCAIAFLDAALGEDNELIAAVDEMAGEVMTG